jgi:hypothetical protein
VTVFIVFLVATLAMAAWLTTLVLLVKDNENLADCLSIAGFVVISIIATLVIL